MTEVYLLVIRNEEGISEILSSHFSKKEAKEEKCRISALSESLKEKYQNRHKEDFVLSSELDPIDIELLYSDPGTICVMKRGNGSMFECVCGSINSDSDI